MKVRDKISDNYRDQVDKLLENQPDKGIFHRIKQEELDEIWEGISKELDIDDVWNNISSDLDDVMSGDSSSGTIVKSMAVLLIVIIGLITLKITVLDSGNSKQDSLTENRQNEQSAEPMVKNKPRDSNTGEQVKGGFIAFSKSLDKKLDINQAIPVKKNRAYLIQADSIPARNENGSQNIVASGMIDTNPDLSLHTIPVEKCGKLLTLSPVGPKKTEVLFRTDMNNQKINENYPATGTSMPLTDRRRISAGLTVFFRNTWLLNQETWNGLKSETLNTTEIVFFPDAALNLNYSFSNSWSIQAEGFLCSNTGQEYSDYIYGHYSTKKITLRYSTIALLVKHKLAGREHLLRRSSINLLAGGYVSALYYANQTINSDLENIKSRYRKFDYGIKLGSEIELSLTDHFSLAPGVFLTLGIPNIYKGEGNIPDYLKSTHNGSAGFQLAFYYHFD